MSPYEVAVGLRYTRARKGSGRNAFISFIALISMAGIALGVAALIVVLSVMNGFQLELRNRILSVASHIEISGFIPLHLGNRIGLVALDPHNCPPRAERVHHDPDAEVHTGRIFDHHAVIAREIRLAFGAIENDRVDLEIVWRCELHMSRKCRTAKSDYACILHRLHNLPGCKPMPVRDETRA